MPIKVVYRGKFGNRDSRVVRECPIMHSNPPGFCNLSDLRLGRIPP